MTAPSRSLPKLTPRLAAVAGLVRQDARLLDVGTDHAYLPAFLVGSGRCTAAVASDLRPGPCDRARETVSACGLADRIRVVQTDGLNGHDLSQFDDIVLAGMGGELILRILAAVPGLDRPGLRLLLQPQTDLPLVRRTMAERGFALETERLAAEGHRLYHILAYAPAAEPQTPDEFALEIGRPEAEPALLARYHERLRQTLEKQRLGLLEAKAPAEEDAARLLHLTRTLALLDALSHP